MQRKKKRISRLVFPMNKRIRLLGIVQLIQKLVQQGMPQMVAGLLLQMLFEYGLRRRGLAVRKQATATREEAKFNTDFAHFP